VTELPSWVFEESDSRQLSEQADEIFDLLARRQRFSYVKINHGFWERLLKTEKTYDLPEAARKKLDWGNFFLVDGFREEIVQQLRRGVSTREGFLLAVSLCAFPGSSRLTGWPPPNQELADLVVRLLPATNQLRDGLMWKWVALEGRLPELAAELKQRPVLLVGPAHLKGLKEYFLLERFSHVEIPLRTARRDRWKICDQIAQWSARAHSDAIVLFQAGSLSIWLIAQLDRQLCPSTLLDMGRVLDLAAPNVAEPQDWVRLQCSKINRATKSLNRVRELRDWDADLADFCAIPDSLFEPGDDWNPEIRGKIAFLEDKPTYAPLVEHLLQTSRKQNHWANHGPISQLLEKAVARLTKLPGDMCVIGCSSATSALEALVALEEEKAGRALRWVLPAYTFPSSLCVCRGSVQILDVGGDGQFSLAVLQAIPESSYDAVLATNLFGRSQNLKALAAFCQARKKAMVIDNATGLDAALARKPGWPNEAISFHHTKPWGMGEGGCILCHRKDEAMLRALTSPGLLGPVAPQRRRNAKLDDYSAARILARLLYRPRWWHIHGRQARRIEEVAGSIGFRAFGRAFHWRDGMATPAFAPMLAPQPVSQAVLDRNGRLTLQKYYRPLASRPIADDLFARVVCIPTHRDLAALSRRQLQELFAHLLEAAQRE
jgi:dTDP-4-amino-4,6-dideoxygalactose transaminase